MEDENGQRQLQVTYQESYAEAVKGIKPYAWVVGISSAAIAFGVLYVFQLFSTGLHQARLYAQMREEVETTTPIKEKLSLPAIGALLSKSDNRVPRVVDLIYLSENSQLEKALQRIKSPSFPILEANDEFEEALSKLLTPAEPVINEGGSEPLVVISEPKPADEQSAQESAPDQSNDELKKELWAYGNAMLRELATPKIEPSVRRVYTSVVQHTKARGYKFPPLP